MDASHKILLLDDDPDLLDMYREILSHLPSRPEIFTAETGARAMAMLEANNFRLLICDLKMPKMDGLQVLSIVRRKYPQLRTVVLTSVVDEQFRSRVYALGVDLFWHKPGTEPEIKMFLECLESLLGREDEGGFRGVQSKSLVDIIQLECISQSSSVLRITNGQLSGKIWIQNGQVIDAAAGELGGEEAFHKILAWRSGVFETLPPEPARAQTITKSYNALLLESAQAFDESRHSVADGSGVQQPSSPLVQSMQLEGVEFVVAMKPNQESAPDARGLDNPEHVATWARESLQRFRGLGERLQAGPVEQIEGLGLQRNIGLATRADLDLCIGFRYSLSAAQVRELMKKVLGLWAS